VGPISGSRPGRAEIAGLKVRDYHTNAGYKSLHFIRKGGQDLSLAINPQTAQRIDDYLATAGHGNDLDGPLFRPTYVNVRFINPRRHLHPEAIDRLLRLYVTQAGLGSGYSAHSGHIGNLIRARCATIGITQLGRKDYLVDADHPVGTVYPTVRSGKLSADRGTSGGHTIHQ
jgi:hypothetical protein